ncbi:MAG: hypothetical protein MJ187_05050 [Alphaproteobacteria bacterium]|nr:hypothetical protein [Alphaproteobacteria bacterium]
MKEILFTLFTLLYTVNAPAASTTQTAERQCEPGYILVSTGKVNGIETVECQKLWCRDLELGKPMGSGKRVNTGYIDTNGPLELCTSDKTCVWCFGDRKWCAGEVPGAWNPQYGAYTRNGEETATYASYQKMGCFGWRLESPHKCSSDEVAVLQNGEWVCSKQVQQDSKTTRESLMRRGGFSKIIR